MKFALTFFLLSCATAMADPLGSIDPNKQINVSLTVGQWQDLLNYAAIGRQKMQQDSARTLSGVVGQLNAQLQQQPPQEKPLSQREAEHAKK